MHGRSCFENVNRTIFDDCAIKIVHDLYWQLDIKPIYAILRHIMNYVDITGNQFVQQDVKYWKYFGPKINAGYTWEAILAKQSCPVAILKDF